MVAAVNPPLKRWRACAKTEDLERPKAMLEVRFHGRGGQGAVTSAELVALAAIELGKYAQSMPSFGPERRGAPVSAYLRVSDEPIRIRAEITRPDIVVVLDDSLPHVVDVTAGLKEKGMVVMSTVQSEDVIREATGFSGRLATVDALGIAMGCLGVPITNTTMIGALVKATGIVPIEAVIRQIQHRFNPKLAEKNAAALKKAFEETRLIEPKPVERGLSPLKRGLSPLPTWRDILPGAIVDTPGASMGYHTGDWRSQTPVYDKEKCSKCRLCYVFCPDAAITIKEDGYVEFNYDYCKGCGICAVECPKDAIEIVKK